LFLHCLGVRTVLTAETGSYDKDWVMFVGLPDARSWGV